MNIKVFEQVVLSTTFLAVVVELVGEIGIEVLDRGGVVWCARLLIGIAMFKGTLAAPASRPFSAPPPL